MLKRFFKRIGRSVLSSFALAATLVLSLAGIGLVFWLWGTETGNVVYSIGFLVLIACFLVYSHLEAEPQEQLEILDRDFGPDYVENSPDYVEKLEELLGEYVVRERKRWENINVFLGVVGLVVGLAIAGTLITAFGFWGILVLAALVLGGLAIYRRLSVSRS